MKIIGLTGGIGSGKSTAAQILGELGAVVIDLDKVGHDVVKKNGGAYKQLLCAFGEGILSPNGEIDRIRLAKIVFNHPEDLKRLNGIVHPVIDEKVEEVTQESRRRGTKVIVLEAAAILEAGKSFQVDELWVITAPEETALERVKDRPGYPDGEAERRIKSQLTDEERIKKADVVINNNGTLEELKSKVAVEWQKLLKRL